MGEEENSKKQHVIFGSAGMAASGMMPGARAKANPKEEPEPEEELQEEPVSEAPPETPLEASEASEATEAPAEPVETDFTGLKAAVLGETGGGDFGEGMDTLFQRLDGVRLFGLTDLNGEAVEDSQMHAGSPAGFSDLGAMLNEVSPDLLSISSSTEHRAKHSCEAIKSGSHVICDVPIARSLKEADELLEVLSSTERKMAVRHPMRLNPHLIRFHAEMNSLIGELCQMNVWGACDETSGGEDLLLNGTPLFDLVRWFGGEVSYCAASVSKDGMAAIAEDAHESEGIDLGPLLGDSIHAEFEMDSGIRVSFVSDRRFQSAYGPAGIEFVGSKSRMRLIAGSQPNLSLLNNPDPGQATKTDVWRQWPEVEGDYHGPVDHLTGDEAALRLVVQDWINAVSDGSQPAASAADAVKALEMAHGVWQAGVTMKRAYFPLANRLHPLSEESQ